MPAALDVDREQIRLLVVEYGITETAKQTGLPLSTILSWSARGKWLKQQPAKLPPTVIQPAINAIKPSIAQANILEHRKQKSRGYLSKFIVNASQVASKSRKPLADAQNARHVGALMQVLWPEKQEPGVNLQILNMNGQAEV